MYKKSKVLKILFHTDKYKSLLYSPYLTDCISKLILSFKFCEKQIITYLKLYKVRSSVKKVSHSLDALNYLKKNNKTKYVLSSKAECFNIIY